MIILLQNIFRFILLIAIQVFVLNNIHFMGFINPYIYILFILLWPVRLQRWTGLLLAFITGLIIDMFNNTPGIHAASAVAIAFLRNPVIGIFTSIEEGSNPVPSFYTFGVGAFVKYVITLTFIHHFLLFILEVFTWTDFSHTLWRISINTLITVVIILGIQSLNKK